MWLLVPLLILPTCTGLKFHLPLLQRRDTPPSNTAGRGKFPPEKRLGSGIVPDGRQDSSKAAKRGFVRPKVGSERDDTTNKFLSETSETAKNILSGTTEVVVATLVNTGPANTFLTPLHNWSRSRKRVAEAVEAAATAAPSEARSATAAERERRRQQRALFEEQEEVRTNNPWLGLLRDTFPLPQPVKNTYSALVSVAAVPGQLLQTGKQTAEALTVAAETAGAMPDRVRETVARGQATARTAQEVLAEAPGRVQEVVTATREFPGKMGRVVEEGTEAVEAAVEAGRKAADAVETLPSRLPDLIETVGDDALSLAEGTAAGADAAGTALWGLTKEVAAWAADLVLRQALTPVHEYRTSTRRVQAALDEELAALPQASLPPRSSAEKAPSNPTALVTAGTTPPVAGDSAALGEDTTPDIGDSMPMSRLVGLRGRFLSWRRKRKSIPAVAVADEDDDEEGDVVENVAVDSKEISAVAAAVSKPAISQEARAETASAAAQAESTIAARRSEEAEVGAAAKTLIAENVLVTDGQVVTGEVLLPVAASVTVGGADEASSKENIYVAPVGALAISVASEDRGAVESAAVPVAARPLGEAADFEDEGKETAADADKRPVARATPADLSDDLDLDQRTAALAGDDESLAGKIEIASERGESQTASASSFAGSSPFSGASSDTGERALADAEQAGGASVGGKGVDYTSSGEKMGSPSSSTVAAIAPSKEVAASAATPRVDTGSDYKNALLGGPNVDTLTKNYRPSPVVNSVESTAAAAVNDAEETVTSTLPSAVGSTARKQETAEAAPLETGERPGPAVSSASPSSPVPTGTALSPAGSPSRHRVSRKKEGRGSPAAQERFEAPTKAAEREGPADDAGATVSSEKPPVVPSEAASDEVAETAAAGQAVPRGAGKAGIVGGGSGTLEVPSSPSSAVNPAAEFLRDWVVKAVPQKKAELKRKESAVCWERQWYPVATVLELLQQHEQQQQQQQRRFQMLDRAYELAPIPREGRRRSPDFRGWGCRAIADDEVSDPERTRSSVGPAAAVAAARVPLRESNGLLWAWPDTSPEGLAAAELAGPAALPDFLGIGGTLGRAPGVWRRLLRRQIAPQRAPESTDEHGGGGHEAERKKRGNQRHALFVEREISCGFSDAVRGLVTASHGQAVRALTAGGNGDVNAPKDDDLLVDASPAGGDESSSGVLRAAFDTSSARGEVLFSSPTVVEWRFSPAWAVQEESATTAATTGEGAVTATSSRQRSWLRRRLSGLGGGGRGSGGVVGRRSRVSRSAAGSDQRDTRALEGGVRQVAAAHYVASLLPVGPNRTKVFARLEVEPSGLLGGRSLWWSRRIRRGLLVAALDEVASCRSAATGGGNGGRLLSSVAEAWLEGAAEGGPF